jgi:hypothetical protein
VQHEFDHLNGILFTDHMIPEEKRALREEIETVRAQGLHPEKEHAVVGDRPSSSGGVSRYHSSIRFVAP